MKLQLFFLVFSLGLLGSFGTPSPVVSRTQLVKKILKSEEISHASPEDVEFAKQLLQELIAASKRVGLGYGNADTYFDKILVNLRAYLHENYNPLEKDHVGDGIETLKVFGLDTIVRTGEANLQTVPGKLTLDAHLGFTSLTGDAAVNKKLWWVFVFKGKVHLEIKNIKLRVQLGIDLKNEMKPVLESLSVESWGHINTKITEGNWLGSIAEWFPGIVTNYLKKAMPDMIKNAVNDVLKEVDFTFP